MHLVHFLWSWGWEEDGGSQSACSQPRGVGSLTSPCSVSCDGLLLKLWSLCWWTATFFGGGGCSSPGDTGTTECRSSLSKALWKLGRGGICSMFFLGIQHHVAFAHWWLARTFCLKNLRTKSKQHSIHFHIPSTLGNPDTTLLSKKSPRSTDQTVPEKTHGSLSTALTQMGCKKQDSLAILHPHQQCTRVSVYIATLVIFCCCHCFFNQGHPDECKVISRCAFAIVVFIVEFMSYVCILYVNPSSDMIFKYFLPFYFSVTQLIVSFDAQRFFIVMQSNLSIFSFIGLCF